MGLASALLRPTVRPITRPAVKQKPKSSLRKILDDLPEDKKVDIPEDQPEGGVKVKSTLSPLSGGSPAARQTDELLSPQEITSAQTSISQIPALFKSKHFDIEEGSRNLDIGGGKFDKGSEYLRKERNVENLIYDPYNRSLDHNQNILEEIAQRPPDTVSISNVLNVIKEPEARKNVIQQAFDFSKGGGKSFFQVYAGDGAGKGKATTKGWQNNKKLRTYIPEIEAVFGKENVKVKGGYIVATKPINNFRKGGMMYEQQMEMFHEGGAVLNDEGGEVEEMSGNKVPLGGVKEGVADDQPANLSAGEMVFSEDVVRYHGVEKMMALRDEAKMGYHKMEAMGQLGNADEATIPTEAIFNPGGMPFSVVDLEYMDMDDDVDVAEAANGMYVQDMQTGGVVQSLIDPATGLPQMQAVPGVAPTFVSTPNVPTNIVNPPGESFSRRDPRAVERAFDPRLVASSTPAVLGTALSGQPVSGLPQTQPANQISGQLSTLPRGIVSTPITTLPTTEQFFGGVQSFNYFINETGQIITIPVINGQQQFEEPEGFQPYDPQDPKPFDPDLEEGEEEEESVTVPSTLQQPPPDVGGGDFGVPSGPAIDPDVDVGPTAGIDVGLSGLDYMADGTKAPDIFDFLADQNVSLVGKGIGKAIQGITAYSPEEIEANKQAYDNKVAASVELDRQLNTLSLTPREAMEYDKAVKEAARQAFEANKQIQESERQAGRTIESDAAKAFADRTAVPAAGTVTGPPGQQGDVGGGGAPDVSAEADVGGFAGLGGIVDPDTADVSVRAKGGLIEAQMGTLVPKIKFKSKPENRRKGLAARK